MTKEKGFTLTETMVVVVVFTFVMSLSLTVFLGSIRVQRAALFQQRLVTEVSYALNRAEEAIQNKEKDETDINKSYIEGFVNSKSIVIDEVKTERVGNRITVLVKSHIKIDQQDKKIELTLQTTAMRR
jgi:prepilin-type N-terminal cleavage/methylation domain-containing protein